MADRGKQNKDSTPPPLLLMPSSKGLTFDSGQTSSLLMPVPQGEASLISSDEEGEADSFLGQTPPQSRHPVAPQPSGPTLTHSGSASDFFQAGSFTADPFSQLQQPQAPIPSGGMYSQPSQPGVPAFSQPSIPSAFSQASRPPASQGFGMQPPAPLPDFASQPPVVPPSSVSQVPPPTSMVPPSSVPGMSGPPVMGGAPPTGPSQNFHRLAGRPKYAQPPMGTYAVPSPPQGLNSQAVPMGGLSQGPPTLEGPPPMGMAPPGPINMGGPPPSTSIGAPPPFSAPDAGGHNPSLGSPQAGPPVMSGPPMVNPTLAYNHYTPVQHHWFYTKHVELKQVWHPFSMADSIKLEESFRNVGTHDHLIVSTDGGRYDVDVIERTRTAVYWDELPSQVRRASWFYRREGDSKFMPYEEELGEQFEEIYRVTLGNNEWHRRHEFPHGEVIVIHNPNVIVSFRASAPTDEYGNVQGDVRPRVVKRGIEEFDNIFEGEPQQIDHVIFVVHGIGPTCDLRFRNIIECVDDFRGVSMQMVKSHFSRYQDEGRIGRIEFLPVKWHQALHGDATGVDRRLKAITLNSIGKLRNFTNDTLLDILFYASPTYAQESLTSGYVAGYMRSTSGRSDNSSCFLFHASPAYTQQIADTVGRELNRLHQLFISRNPNFRGNASVAGHSLGSLILFDLLTHQHDSSAPCEKSETLLPTEPVTSAESLSQQSTRASTPASEVNGDLDEEEISTIDDLLTKLSLTSLKETFQKEEMDLDTLVMCEDSDIKEIGIPLGPRKKIQGFIKKQRQKKDRRKEEEERSKQEVLKQQLNASASQDSMQSDHGHDPLLRSYSNTSVNYMMGVAGTGIPFVQYPQLKFSPNHFFALGSPIAMFLTVRGVETLGEEFRFPTCPGFFNIFHPFDPVAYRIEPLILPTYPTKPFLMPHHKGRKRLHLELKETLARSGAALKAKMMDYLKHTWRTINDFALAHRQPSQEALEEEVDNVMSEMSPGDDDETASIVSSLPEDDVMMGSINQGRRIDYVLQEKPIESFNDYLFALGSHLCYWESEDTILLILKEVYGQLGIAPTRPGSGNTQMHTWPAPPPQSVAGVGGVFPRHPLATAPPTGGLPQSQAAQIVSPSSGQYGRPPLLPPSSQSANNNPVSGFSPPPLSGFVRK